MGKRLSRLFLCSLGVASLLTALPGSTSAQEVIQKAGLEELLQRVSATRPRDFATFAKDLRPGLAHDGLARALDRRQTKAALDDADRVNLYRLLGLYTRIKYRDELIATLARFVAIPTDKKENLAQHDNPNIHRMGRAIEAVARKFGLAFRNFDNRIFEVTLKGTGSGSIGIFTHSDVVPVNPAKWLLRDGKKLDPFKLTVMGDRMYGRGASDNKGSIAAALYVLGSIKREGFIPSKTIRLAIETTEETGGSATEYYKTKTTLAPYNLVLDGRYPVGVAEKGFGIVMAKFPVRKGSGPGGEILHATGGVVFNQIPAEALAVIAAADAPALKRALDPLAARYVAANGANFKIETRVEGDRVRLTVFGEGAHSARPSRGVNPVSRLFDFLHQVRRAAPLKRNHFTDAAAYVSDNWGLNYHGGKLGIGYSDPFMGALTTPVTYVKVKDGALHLVVNPRAPRGKDRDQLVDEIRRALDTWKRRTGTDVSISVKIKRPMYRDPKGPWIQHLLVTFREVSGIDAKPRSSNGYTSARQLPNGVQFGPGVPGQRGRAHKPNEFKLLSNLLRDVQIVTEAVLRLGNLERME
ncbi:MAG: dipeptidase [Alphaproteobacteria bacterium]|nr:dipeptidase [Alphaproteobacteria bacterium]